MPRTLMLVIDTQYDFMMTDGLLSVAGAEAIIPDLVRTVVGLDPEEFAGVVFTFDTHEPEAFSQSEEGGMFPLHCEKGTPGWENVINPSLVPPVIPAYTLEKGVFDMWHEDDLKIVTHDNPAHPRNIPRTFIQRDRDEFFREQKERGVEKIVIVGVASDFCVRDAIAGALERGFEVEVPAHLTAGIERDIHTVCKDDFGSGFNIVGKEG